MRIFIIGNADQKSEWQQDAPLPESVEWLPVLPAQLANDDVLIDLLFDETTDRQQEILATGAGEVMVNSVVLTNKQLPKKFCRINGWSTFLGCPVEACSLMPLQQSLFEKVFKKLGKEVCWTADLPGFVSARIIASIINEAFFAVADGVSTEADIDSAMQWGTAYPYGPFAWADKIGRQRVRALLNALTEQQTRYTPAANL